ncbi:hypothetical protein P4H28_12750 [Paenibacillus larvae]|nr:hypothetical protein [Paenibacillus larvae]MEC0187296.1 hypothetical protein [Paenibacillus larvae]
MLEYFGSRVDFMKKFMVLALGVTLLTGSFGLAVPVSAETPSTTNSNLSTQEWCKGISQQYKYVSKFYADYVIVSGGPSYISNVYTLSVGVVGGTHSDKSLVLRKEREDFRGPAEAVLQFKVTFYGSSASGDYWVKLNVGGGNAWESHS